MNRMQWMKYKNKKIDHSKKSFYLYMIMSSCFFSRGIFMLFLSRKGLDFAQIGLYQMLVQLSMFVFEIPTGYIGDKFGKIKSLQIGTFLLLLHCIVLIFTKNQVFLIFSGLIEGIGYTFRSGSNSALLYELLKSNHEEHSYLKINANLQAIQSILMGGSISLGAIMVTYSWNSVYYITAICLSVSLVFLAMVTEPEETSKYDINRNSDILGKLKGMIRYPHVIVFIIYIIGFSCFDGISGSYYNFNQIIFSEREISVSLIGIFFSITYLANSIAYSLAGYISKWMSSKKIIAIVLILQGILFIGLAFVNNKSAFIILSFCCCLIPEIVYILADSIIQVHITSSYRATILSIVSMISSLVSALAYSLIGVIMNSTDVNSFMLILGTIILGIFCCFEVLYIYDKNNNENRI